MVKLALALGCTALISATSVAATTASSQAPTSFSRTLSVSQRDPAAVRTIAMRDVAAQRESDSAPQAKTFDYTVPLECAGTGKRMVC